MSQVGPPVTIVVRSATSTTPAALHAKECGRDAPTLEGRSCADCTSQKLEETWRPWFLLHNSFCKCHPQSVLSDSGEGGTFGRYQPVKKTLMGSPPAIKTLRRCAYVPVCSATGSRLPLMLSQPERGLLTTTALVFWPSSSKCDPLSALTVNTRGDISLYTANHKSSADPTTRAADGVSVIPGPPGVLRNFRTSRPI